MAPDALLNEAKRMAKDMASIDPSMLGQYKNLINQGFEASFGEGLALEAQVSSAANGRVSADDVEARRRTVLNRGRAQAQ